MKQIAIISGKGGTGKTTLSASLSYLFQNPVMSDCDVDASNLHLLLSPVELKQSYEYYGGKKAEIDYEKCTNCGICKDTCRFEAIDFQQDKYVINEYACEGCKLCVLTCPEKAIKLVENLAGYYYESKSPKGVLVHGDLNPGEETSGGLVAEIRKKSFSVGENLKKDVIIIDGAPGIGCPATSSVAGVNYAIIVTEPTLSGFHDLQRAVETLKKMRVKFGVVINKFDLNESVSSSLEEWCFSENIDLLGKIPFDEMVNLATREAKPIILYEDSISSKYIKSIYQKISQILFNK
ncbi:(4Fe-4S)-binding protein [Petrotoga sp. 9T1HF07.CasAA.8.2]|uniref:ATP-binding protein n=1 Tax=Petrotoga sp. 9T1HF07.CasAA.8.2 TaxID=1434329 RepID=UPI000CA90937|nr:ATP-binding protein [Petrotoga sp. 9T1HF07.CasAA.8.2]PNR89784.1 (4Fe-4S)-binding protein [Petrotoga sp. 9T1HF07.CasAA.8.2]